MLERKAKAQQWEVCRAVVAVNIRPLRAAEDELSSEVSSILSASEGVFLVTFLVLW